MQAKMVELRLSGRPASKWRRLELHVIVWLHHSSLDSFEISPEEKVVRGHRHCSFEFYILWILLFAINELACAFLIKLSLTIVSFVIISGVSVRHRAGTTFVRDPSFITRVRSELFITLPQTTLVDAGYRRQILISCGKVARVHGYGTTLRWFCHLYIFYSIWFDLIWLDLKYVFDLETHNYSRPRGG